MQRLVALPHVCLCMAQTNLVITDVTAKGYVPVTVNWRQEVTSVPSESITVDTFYMLLKVWKSFRPIDVMI